MRSKLPYPDAETPGQFLANAEYHQERADRWNKVARVSLAIAGGGFLLAAGSTVAGLLCN